MSEILLKMEDVSKSFPGVQALNCARLELKQGEVHALLGENGAGKSTLMKILTGIYTKDTGTITYQNEEIEVPDTRTAQQLGINIIHQELNLAKDLTVAQNIFLGREPKSFFNLFVDENKMNKEAEKLFSRLNITIDPKANIASLTVAKQQMVEIAKALSFNSKVLIMDEPTAALTNNEIDSLFEIISQLRKDGVGIVYISHRMEELKRITDRVTIMRDGHYIDTLKTTEATIDEIIAMMVGREISNRREVTNKEKSEDKVLEVKGISRGNVLKDVSFNLKKGEVLGFAGLIGAGRTEVARVIFGADPSDSGEIFINGKKVQIKNPSDAVKLGIGYLSEDRKELGLVVDMDIKSNIAMSSMKKYTGPLGWIKSVAIQRKSEKLIDQLKVKTPSINQRVKNLSGGNQQKVVIGKWLDRDCEILIFDEPTRGIDIGAKDEIYKLLNQLVEQGKSIIMISSELPEILRMSDRILVMCEGRITGELENENVTQEQIMKYATQRIG